ncbi:hypothetical protein ACTQ54_01645 [Fundicoccus sp. Sow4_H7]|uniref:aspartate-alanine antiporter-like transporter n=1 Tax=Fundicoccus sp. Sow4_H7 TaxID=3438784 RepID=UPI003F8E9FCB
MNEIAYLFLIIVIGYLIGSINFLGIKFGNSAVLLVTLVFGHFGVVVSEFIGNFGFVIFLFAVDLSAGHTFLHYFKNNGIAFVTMSALVIISVGILTAFNVILFDLPLDLTLGIIAASMTSSPALAAAQDIGAGQLATIGYGLTYVFGVVFFLQIMPRLFKVDRERELQKLKLLK